MLNSLNSHRLRFEYLPHLIREYVRQFQASSRLALKIKTSSGFKSYKILIPVFVTH